MTNTPKTEALEGVRELPELLRDALKALETATSFTSKKARDQNPALIADIRAALAATPAAPRSAAPGWVLVPVNPTKAMQDAWDTAPFSEDTDVEFAGAYRAMLAAAPPPVTPSEGGQQ